LFYDPVGFHGLRIECAASLIGFRGASHLYRFDDLSRLRCRHGLDGCCCRSDFIGLSCFRWPSRSAEFTASVGRASSTSLIGSAGCAISAIGDFCRLADLGRLDGLCALRELRWLNGRQFA
jgi:hypothetical protein